MAKEMKGAHWDVHGKKFYNGPVKYPWAQWFNGSMWLLIQGEDFDWDTKEFQRYLLTFAKRWNVNVKTKTAENGKDLYIKATGNRPLKDPGKRRNEHFKAIERTREERYGPYESD